MSQLVHPAQSYLAWAKSKGPDDFLSHSSIDMPLLGDAVNQAYCSAEFVTMLHEDNQWGHRRLRAAVANRYGVEDTDEQPRVLLTPGASSAIFLVCKALLSPGDEILIEAPTYEPFVAAAQSAGAKIVWWRRKGLDFSLDLDSLVRDNLLTKRTRLILISNPHNPSGNLSPDPELKHLAQMVKAFGRSDIKVVVDEIYRDLLRHPIDTFQSQAEISTESSAASAAVLGDEFIAINSLSKVYGLSRLRTGWILGAPDIIQRIRRTYEIVINIGSLDTEAASAVIFPLLDNYLPAAQTLVRDNRRVLRNVLTPLLDNDVLSGDVPHHGCVCFPKLGAKFTGSHSPDASSVINVLENLCGVVPGAYFGKEYSTHFRLGLGGDTANFRNAANSLVAILKRLANGVPT